MYCLYTMNDGTDWGIFQSDKNDERLTWDQVTSMPCIQGETWFNFKDTTYNNYLKNGGS